MTSSDEPLNLTEGPLTGASRYSDAYPGLREAHPRIYVRFRPDGTERGLSFFGLVDTAAHFCILNEGITELIRDRLTESVGQMRLRSAHGVIEGELYLHRIEFLAQVGENLDVEATVLVCPYWQGPSFLGYTGVLDRLRFVIDPRCNRFAFAASE